MAKDYIVVCVSLYPRDLDLADIWTEHAKRQGWTASSRSDILRHALRQLTEKSIPKAPSFGGKLADYEE